MRVYLSTNQINALIECAKIGAEGYPEDCRMKEDINWILENILNKSITFIHVVTTNQEKEIDMTLKSMQTEPRDEDYTVIYYDIEAASLIIVRVVDGKEEDLFTSIPIADLLKSTTDLPIILTDEGKVDITKEG